MGGGGVLGGVGGLTECRQLQCIICNITICLNLLVVGLWGQIKKKGTVIIHGYDGTAVITFITCLCFSHKCT